MVYWLLTILLLGSYIAYLQYKLRLCNKNLKKLLQENDRQTTENLQFNGDIYFKIDKNFYLTFVNEALEKTLGFKKDTLIGKPILGTLMEDNDANLATLKSTSNKINKSQNTINSELIILSKNGEKKLVNCRQRPILNEILECEGISFLCKDITQAKAQEETLNKYKDRDLLTNVLKEDIFLKRMEHDFMLGKRYNKDFSFAVIELKDIYDFISKGIDFETADRLLRNMAEALSKDIPEDWLIGRLDKTKIALAMNGVSRSKARVNAQQYLNLSKKIIQSLGVDAANAEMVVVLYSSRKDYNDTFDIMLERARRHVNRALKHHEYGVTTSETPSGWF